jgi:hypothetical protein
MARAFFESFGATRQKGRYSEKDSADPVGKLDGL